MSKEFMSNQPEPTTTGEIIEVQPQEVNNNLAPVLTTKDLQIRIAEETEQRKLITEFITNHMKAGVDYGTIKIKTRDGREVESKPSLFKPGSEKFCSLFHFRPTFERDDDTWEMSGKVPGLFCYKCELLAANGAIVGEGRGSANVGEKQGWTVNNALKIAEKRAQIDAVLRTGGLSDFFTQDLEDMPKEVLSGDNGNTTASKNRPTQQSPRPQHQGEYKADPNRPLQGQMTEAQNRAIFANLKRLNITADQLKTEFRFNHISELSKQQASDILDRLFKTREWTQE